MQRIILGLFFCLLATPLPALSAPNDKYIDANIKDLTQFTAYYNAIDLNNLKVFEEYLKVNDCDLYTKIKNNQFEQQKVKNAFQERISATGKRGDTELFFRVGLILQVKKYNFDTQSMDILPANQLKKINTLELLPPKTVICETDTTYSLSVLPYAYSLKLNFPVSLIRVPLQQDLAESITNQLERDFSRPDTMLLFGNIFVRIEAIQPQLSKSMKSVQATLRGQVDAIEIYSDRDRQLLIKRLDYRETP